MNRSRHHPTLPRGQRNDRHPRKKPWSDPAVRPELRLPTAAAQTRIVSVARIRLDPRKSVRPFKGIICAAISEFESHMPSQTVRSLPANVGSFAGLEDGKSRRAAGGRGGPSTATGGISQDRHSRHARCDLLKAAPAIFRPGCIRTRRIRWRCRPAAPGCRRCRRLPNTSEGPWREIRTTGSPDAASTAGSHAAAC
jgi:hypothetical protein